MLPHGVASFNPHLTGVGAATKLPDEYFVYAHKLVKPLFNICQASVQRASEPEPSVHVSERMGTSWTNG